MRLIIPLNGGIINTIKFDGTLDFTIVFIIN